MATPAKSRRGLLYDLLASWDSTAAAIDGTKRVIENLGPWLFATLHLLNDETKTKPQPEYELWKLDGRSLSYFLRFLDPDRMERLRAVYVAVAKSKKHQAEQRKRSEEAGPSKSNAADTTPLPLLSSDSANDLDEARRAFVNAGIRRLQKDAEREDGEDGARSRYREGSEAWWRARAALERVWWSSFQRSTWPVTAFELAGEVYGSEYAYAKASPAALKVRNRVVSMGPAEPRDGKPSVVVFGAGIAGLTAAHELAERGFEVTVVEKIAPRVHEDDSAVGGALKKTFGLDLKTLPRGRSEASGGVHVQVGGLARTQWKYRDPTIGALRGAPRKNPAAEPEKGVLPGEHGYRYFPSFYRHVFDTMQRTPLPGTSVSSGRYATAFDQLQPTFKEIFAKRTHDVSLSRDRPRTLEGFRQEYTSLTKGLGFERRDLSRFFYKLLRYLLSSSERRKTYENQTLFQFLGCDVAGAYSQPFLDAIKNTPKALVAMDAEHCDARTQLNSYLQLLTDQILGSPFTDATLRGPTSVAWFEPWRTYLESLGVRFQNAELLSLATKNKTCTAILEWGPQFPDRSRTDYAQGADYFVVALDAVAAEQVTFDWDINGVPRELRNFTSYVNHTISADLDRYVISVGFRDEAPLSRRGANEELRSLIARAEAARGPVSAAPAPPLVFRSIKEITGELVADGEDIEEIRISLWFDSHLAADALRALKGAFQSWAPSGSEVRLISYAERSHASMQVSKPRFPQLTYGAAPDDRFQTFTGVQYYLAEDFKLVRGYVYFPDSDWGLSAVSQSQFWWHSVPGFLPKDVRGVFSVDIGNTQKKSSFTHANFLNSTQADIENEVWRQVSDGLRTTRGPTSVITNLPIPKQIAVHIDGNLQFATDGLRANLTPFLINNAGDWDNRPQCQPWVPGQSKFSVATPRTDSTGVWQAPYGGYRVHDNKVVFCGTYMRTFTRLTTMEAANESARHAVNAVLSHMAYGTEAKKGFRIAGDYCDIWDPEQNELEDLEFFKRVDAMLLAAGKPAIADILRFDDMADVQYPLPTDGQALLASLVATTGKDWGVQPIELAGAFNGLTEVVRKLGIDLGPLTGGPDSPLGKLMSTLGFGKAGTPGSK